MKRPLVRRSVLAVLLISFVLTIHAPQAQASSARPIDSRGPCTTLFSDVGPGHPFCSEIEEVALYGILDGYPDGSFRPTAYVTREALTAWLYRLAGAPYGFDPECIHPPYSDVTSSTFCGEIEWAADFGVIHGFPDSTFRPAAPVTRQAAAAIFFNFITRSLVPPCDMQPFTDVSPGHSFCGPILWFWLEDYSDGYPDGTFRPGAAVTRQAAAAWIQQAITYPPVP